MGSIRAPRTIRSSFRVLAVGLIGLAGFVSGCGEDDPLNRQPVSGTVTLDGQPLDQGSITFSQMGAGDGSGGSGVTISGGQYSLPEEQGLPPGRYVVRIHSPEGGAVSEMPGESKPAKERIPKSWNVQSKHEIEVVEGDNDFPFDVKSSE